MIILNYNGKDLLGECLDSLRAQTFRDFEVILVDNGSSDGSVDLVRSTYPDVTVIENGTNLGFGEGNNVGIRVATGEIVALLNNDTVVDMNWLAAFADALKHADRSVGMWASKILFFDSPGIIDNTGHLIYPDGLNFGRGRGDRDEGQYDREEEAFFPSGCAAFFRRTMLDEIGLFDADFFAYGDDTELGLRARLAGWTCLFVPSAIVYHKYSATAGRYSPLKAYLVERNRIWVLVKYFPVRHIIMSPLYSVIRLLYHLIASLSKKGAAGQFTRSFSLFELVKVQVKADIHAVMGIGTMIRKRRQVRKITRTSVREFSAWLRKYSISAREIAYGE